MASDHPTIGEQITFLYTSNLSRSARFYEGVLGLPLALDQGGCRIYRVAAGAYIGVCERAPEMLQAPDPRRRGVILTLVTPEVERMHEVLTARGAAFEQPPQGNADYGITHAFLRDPNGYLIEIQRFDDPDWDRSR